MQIQQNLNSYQNQLNFGAIAFRKPVSGQNAHQAAQELSKQLGIDGSSIHAPYATIDGILLQFKTPALEQQALATARSKGIKNASLPDGNINKKRAKGIMHSLDVEVN
jgi:hypothetical protein